MEQNGDKTGTRFTMFDPGKINREKTLEIAKEMEPAGKYFLKEISEILKKNNHKNPVETSEAVTGVLLGIIDAVAGGENTTGILITLLYRSFMVEQTRKGLGEMSKEEMLEFIKDKEKLGDENETPSYFG